MHVQYTPTLSPHDVERFWRLVDKHGPIPSHCPELGPCWLWTRKPNCRGYGRFGVGGRVFMAHRVAYVVGTGGIPDGLLILHRCDVRLCCRFSHLFLGDCAANSQDMVLKGRSASGDRAPFRQYPELVMRGEEHPQAKLSLVAVEEIKRILLLEERPSQEALAERFGVTQSTISNIKRGIVWKDATVLQ